MQVVCDILEQLLSEGIVSRYAVGGATAATPNNPSGRVRAVLAPREQASAPGASASQPGISLKPINELGGSR